MTFQSPCSPGNRIGLGTEGWVYAPCGTGMRQPEHSRRLIRSSKPGRLLSTMPDLLSLRSLELALLDQQHADVRAFFEAADVCSSNEALMEAGQQYGFLTCVSADAPLRGQAVMLARDLAKLMYGKEDTAPLGKLLRTYGFDFMRLQGSEPEVKTLLVQHFHLSKFDGKAAFAQYEAPLTAVERIGWYAVRPAQRSLAERLARLLGLTMPALRQWMHDPRTAL